MSIVLPFFGRSVSPDGSDEPIRDQIFSLERLEQHAKKLASEHQTTTKRQIGKDLSKRTRDNARVLLASYRTIVKAVQGGGTVTPAAEWLLDNFYVIDEQLREITKDLPNGFYRHLPKLASGKLGKYPRVLGLAWDFVAHTDSHFNTETLISFVKAYQAEQPLEIGELWALPITLRIVLVENLRRISERVTSARAARQAADHFADELLGFNSQPSAPLETMLGRLERQVLPKPFMVQLAQRMREREAVGFRVTRWLETHLERQQTTLDEIVTQGYQAQSAANLTVRNIITSMRLISAVDWAVFFESVSLVDQELRLGLGFAESDFATRDSYRHAIEELGRGSKYAEVEIARLLVQLTASNPTSERHQDVGYYLIANGRSLLERQVDFRATPRQWLFRTYRLSALPWYLGAIGFISLAITLLGFLTFTPQVSLLERILLALLVFIPASDLALALINNHVTRTFEPRTLPKLELKNGVPASLRTLVVVPTLFTSEQGIIEEFERLEVRYLANADGDLRFAILADFADAPSQTMPNDQALLKIALETLAALNQRHDVALNQRHEACEDSGLRFLLFLRHRVYSPSEQTWMGWERKRGKLHEFNRLLRGATDTTFMDLELELPKNVRFIISLDADTRLPRGAACRLVGAMAHPLNRPRFDHNNRVIEGYGVLQPRITLSLPSERHGTVFQRVFSSHAGMDPYASAVSDVYQDLFGEGSYAGKGIYDLDAFEQALAGRVPETALLSHDLFEGLFARAGLVSDVELIEEYPSHYGVRAARQHRWVRGDWQLLPWIFSSRAPISTIGRWKMLDNLRRSLVPICTVLALVLGWLLPVSPLLWSAFILVLIALPMLIPFFDALMSLRLGASRRSYFLSLRENLTLGLAQFLLTLTFLADQTWQMFDAIIRTLVRLFVTQRNLLEWRTAAQAQAGSSLRLTSFYRQMLAAPILAFFLALLVRFYQPSSWSVAVPFLVLWALSPFLARWASLYQPPRRLETLNQDQQTELRLIARRTWRFFERFISPQDHYLPPDNFQEDPQPKIAHRTSPTNIGLALLSTISAYDFGWLGRTETIERLELSFDSIEKLELYRGHLYNWYDTQTLQPLEPRYVSTVDSGNLAGHLLAFRQACFELQSRPLLGTEVLQGLSDTLQLARAVAQEIPKNQRPQSITPSQLNTTLQAVEAALTMPEDWVNKLKELVWLADTVADMAATLVSEQGNSLLVGSELNFWLRAFRASLQSHIRDLPEPNRVLSEPNGVLSEPNRVLSELNLEPSLESRLQALAQRAEDLFLKMEFGFLFDETKKLFAIGYDQTNQRRDSSSYDLLASEARLTSFIAIAKDEVPTSHWFHLGRELTPVEQGTALVSWTGSMFEYLMPRLVMHSPAGSLLEETSHLVVQAQIAYAASRSTLLQPIPWGISESAFAARDLALNYQYLAFGVPGLGLKRGLGDDLVIAPYATALAAMINPTAATQNFRRLKTIGAQGIYGFYDAIDFTASRLPEGTRQTIVRNYMAHHQGMALVALANVLLEDKMTKRFHRDARVQATELLLQERTPRAMAVARPRSEEVTASRPTETNPADERVFSSLQAAAGQTHMLSNGRYNVMLSAVGSGYSRWNNLAITRWREDPTRDDYGSYIYVAVLPDERGLGRRVWSATPQPLGLEPEGTKFFETKFFEDRAEFVRRDGNFETKLEVIVSPEDDAELRRLTLTNHDSKAREIELTSYHEVVLATPAADDAHPAFSKLFVETEFVAGTLLATRRPRSALEPRIWLAHTAVVEGSQAPQFETDRARFLGRGLGVHQPASIINGGLLSGTVGAVLDPILSLRRRVRLEAGATVRVTFSTLVAATRAAALELAERYNDPETFERALTLSWTRTQVELHHLGISASQVHVFQRLAGFLLYPSSQLLAANETLERNTLGQSGLWRHGISGDLPIVLLRIDDLAELELVSQVLRAYEYWQTKGLTFDLVILNEQPTSYMQALQEAIENLVRSKIHFHENPTHVYVLRGDLLSKAEHDLLQSASRVVLRSRLGTLAEQVSRSRTPVAKKPALNTQKRLPSVQKPTVQPTNLEFFNGLGGFAKNGLEYQITLGAGQWTPAPWINVIANPNFGFTVSESGSGYTWAQNSRENKLTVWSNDPVSDTPSEMIFIRDEETLELFSATPLPIREDSSPYTIAHGQGYSRFTHETHGLNLELTQFVADQDPIKISHLVIENHSPKARKISVTAYLEWVLGASREANARHIITELEPQTKAILARNHWSEEFSGAIAFTDLIVQWQAGKEASFTCDRLDFIGRFGQLSSPLALQTNQKLSNKLGAGLDPCAAMQTVLDLPLGARIEVVVLLGQSETRAEALALLQKYRNSDISLVLLAVKNSWQDTLGTVQVKTPNRAMDIMLNRWLPYQTLSARIYGRTGFYQAGGAYGFRDQLQDTMALASLKPDLAREQLLRAASRQFLEGDVQHWWHPPSGRGVRTRISDDLIWLPYAISHYLAVTTDRQILEQPVLFIEGDLLEPDQEDAYFTPRVSQISASLFEHGAKALEKSLALGTHGLPLIGSGDWNDGMNRVGSHGQGESVWLGWFLYTNLVAWATLAANRQETERANTWQAHAQKLQQALETNAWDGDWYKRAFYDDGTPLGSAENDECKIDSIAQTWAVISGAANPTRATQAMNALNQYLVKPAEQMVLLFTPPFEHTNRDPGYIKGYLPGVRENGGQYTHAAVWSVIAFAMLGDGDKAFELFSMINPIAHSSTRAEALRYKVEPYVLAADVYAQPPHNGRGGWTWYTGSSGWLYRAGLESILGFELRGKSITINPCIPRAWSSYQIDFKYHGSVYQITVENPDHCCQGVKLLELDGQAMVGSSFELTNDGLAHFVRVVLGKRI